MKVAEWQKKFPMQITLSRMFLMPFIVACLYPDQLIWNVTAAVLFILASITDYFDGYYARKWNAVSNEGKFMDPIADKVLVTGVLVMLLAMHRIDVFMVILILVRDTYIGGIRSVAAADQIIIAAKPAGKWKTALQMSAIPAVMVDNFQEWITNPVWAEYSRWIGKIGYGVLWISVILSITSGIEYYLGYQKEKRKS